jgi:Uma2 family endonuclease
MRAESISHLVTAEELPGISIPGKSIELVRGVLVVREPPSTRHGRVAARMSYLVSDHVYRHELGAVIQDAGFKIESDPDTVRAPDVAFVSRSRVDEIPPTGFARFAPDLAVEVVSPNDRPGELLAKVAQLLDAGSRLVWVVDPIRAKAVVYRENGDITIVGPDDRLDGEDVLPGFGCALAEVLR